MSKIFVIKQNNEEPQFVFNHINNIIVGSRLEEENHQIQEECSRKFVEFVNAVGAKFLNKTKVFESQIVRNLETMLKNLENFPYGAILRNLLDATFLKKVPIFYPDILSQGSYYLEQSHIVQFTQLKQQHPELNLHCATLFRICCDFGIPENGVEVFQELFACTPDQEIASGFFLACLDARTKVAHFITDSLDAIALERYLLTPTSPQRGANIIRQHRPLSLAARRGHLTVEEFRTYFVSLLDRLPDRAKQKIVCDCLRYCLKDKETVLFLLETYSTIINLKVWLIGSFIILH
jgi:hypothetical protein